jgi:hypothetical protein
MIAHTRARAHRRAAQQSGGTWGNLYYSWDYGNIHFIALDSESFEYFEMSPQHVWLKQDLHKVNRTKTPWVVAFWHTPWYCSNTGIATLVTLTDNSFIHHVGTPPAHRSSFVTPVHEGAGWLMKGSFEDLFYKYKVDLVLQGTFVRERLCACRQCQEPWTSGRMADSA